ncbi:hypothetical protein ZHAS_00017291 [Anopheles sinensis]|uniref:Uncharacterized protein n=1 Tax=Anopheles sinensis TaxID=74873 RepID=A0A084WFZ2_ANOSI|nr:hypothetical protein ZHAS_00017291 [Anopheles sinensis]
MVLGVFFSDASVVKFRPLGPVVYATWSSGEEHQSVAGVASHYSIPSSVTPVNHRACIYGIFHGALRVTSVHREFTIVKLVKNGKETDVQSVASSLLCTSRYIPSDRVPFSVRLTFVYGPGPDHNCVNGKRPPVWLNLSTSRRSVCRTTYLAGRGEKSS